MSVSHLESLRYWKGREDSRVEDLIADLTRKSAPTPQMEAGGDLASLFESVSPGALDEVIVDGWHFKFELDAEIDVPLIRELKAETVYATPSGPVTLVGKVDGLHGTTIRDQKLSEAWDAEKYTDSLQWRAYLVMFKAHRFVYDVFVGRYAKDRKEVVVTDYHRLPFYRYPGIEDDVQQAVNELADVITRYVPSLVQP
jgi:hypothetical protein